MSFPGSILFPPPFSLPDPFHGPPTLPGAEALPRRSTAAIEHLVAAVAVTGIIEKIFMMDYPRSGAGGCPHNRFPAALDSVPVTPALCLPHIFAGRCGSVFLLCLPSVPLPGLPPAFAAAIPFGCSLGAKSSPASFQQTAACSWPPSPAPSTSLLIMGMAGGTFRSAQGGMLPEAHVSDRMRLLFEKYLLVGLRHGPQAIFLRDVNHNLS